MQYQLEIIVFVNQIIYIFNQSIMRVNLIKQIIQHIYEDNLIIINLINMSNLEYAAQILINPNKSNQTLTPIFQKFSEQIKKKLLNNNNTLKLKIFQLQKQGQLIILYDLLSIRNCSFQLIITIRKQKLKNFPKQFFYQSTQQQYLIGSNIKFSACILKNSLPLNLKSKQLVLMCCRNLSTRINSNGNHQSIKLNPQNGQIRIASQSIMPKYKFQQMMKKGPILFQNRILKLIKNISAQREKFLDIYYQNYDYKISSSIAQQSKDFRQIQPNDNLINNMIHVGKYSFGFMKKEQNIPKKVNGKPLDIKQNNKNYKMIQDLVKPDNKLKPDNKIKSKEEKSIDEQLEEEYRQQITKKFKRYQPIFKNLNLNIMHPLIFMQQLKQKLSKIKQEMQKKSEKFQDVLRPSIYKNTFDINVYSEISIKNLTNIVYQLVAYGRSCKIQKGRVIYQLKNTQIKKEITKILAQKTEIEKPRKEKVKISKQKKILEQMAQYYCVQIAKFYYTEQETQSLFLDFYEHRSLQEYRENNRKTLSIFNKLYFLVQILHGMRFYTFFDIVHLDIKPGNMFIGRKLILRIGDFGQSRSLNTTKSTRPGYTFPYVAPDIFRVTQKNPKYSWQQDVYGLGILMFDLFFQKFPLNLRKLSQQNFIEKLKQFPDFVQQIDDTKLTFKQKQTQRIKRQQYQAFTLKNFLYVREDLNKYLNQKLVRIMEDLCRLCLKCIGVKAERPNLDWILLTLRQILEELENFQLGEVNFFD